MITQIAIDDYDAEIAGGSECVVYNTSDFNMLLKLYFYSDAERVREIIDLNKEYFERGLAPNVYGDIVEKDGMFGYFVERIEPVEFDELENYRDKFENLIERLSLDEDDVDELYHNWGLTSDGCAVLFDFGGLTMRLLGLPENAGLKTNTEIYQLTFCFEG